MARNKLRMVKKVNQLPSKINRRTFWPLMTKKRRKKSKLTTLMMTSKCLEARKVRKRPRNQLKLRMPL